MRLAFNNLIAATCLSGALAACAPHREPEIANLEDKLSSKFYEKIGTSVNFNASAYLVGQNDGNVRLAIVGNMLSKSGVLNPSKNDAFYILFGGTSSGWREIKIYSDNSIEKEGDLSLSRPLPPSSVREILRSIDAKTDGAWRVEGIDEVSVRLLAPESLTPDLEARFSSCKAT